MCASGRNKGEDRCERCESDSSVPGIGASTFAGIEFAKPAGTPVVAFNKAPREAGQVEGPVGCGLARPGPSLSAIR